MFSFELDAMLFSIIVMCISTISDLRHQKYKSAEAVQLLNTEIVKLRSNILTTDCNLNMGRKALCTKALL